MLQHSEACERNKHVILEKLLTAFADVRLVLEIGSGTAQHAVHFAAHLPHLTWQPSDLAQHLPAVQARLDLEGGNNIRAPLELDVARALWPISDMDAIFTANTLHIMSWQHVLAFFSALEQNLQSGSMLCVYGPFKYKNEYTSASNAEFDLWLNQRDPVSGIRDFEAVDALAQQQQLKLLADHSMPANNQLLVWQKQ